MYCKLNPQSNLLMVFGGVVLGKQGSQNVGSLGGN